MKATNIKKFWRPKVKVSEENTESALFFLCIPMVCPDSHDPSGEVSVHTSFLI